MEKELHIMIDLETLDTQASAVITQLGYAGFYPNGTGTVFQGCAHLNVAQQMDVKRTISWSTVKWWMDQEDAARKLMTQPERVDVKRVLDDFASLPWKEIKGVWSHGLTFDVVLLAHLHADFGRQVPWDFRAPRDTRTIFWASGVPMVKNEAKHQADMDAVAQALTVQNALKALNIS